MVRQYKSNDKGTNELKAQASEQGGGRPVGDKPKKVWDFFLNTDTGYGENKRESSIVAGMEIKAGRAKESGNKYFMLTGFSKDLGGVNASLTKQVPKIIEQLVDAGFGEEICEVLSRKKILE